MFRTINIVRYKSAASRSTTAAKYNIYVLAGCSRALIRALEGETVRVIECGLYPRWYTRCGPTGEHSVDEVGGGGDGLEYKSETNSKSSSRGARNDIRPCVKHRRRIQSVSLSHPEGPSREGESRACGLNVEFPQTPWWIKTFTCLDEPSRLDFQNQRIVYVMNDPRPRGIWFNFPVYTDTNFFRNISPNVIINFS